MTGATGRRAKARRGSTEGRGATGSVPLALGPSTLAHPHRAPAHWPAALLVALLLIPSIAADHVYSHRLVVDGRLVGNEGAPLAGREIELFSEGDDFLEPCREGPHQSITDASGDFRFCFHQHELSAATKVGVRHGNATAVRPVDVATRRMTMMLREPNETSAAPEDWNSTYRVGGRVWRPGPQALESVQVFGVAVIGLPVNLSVRGPDGSETVFRTQTDAYGDFDLVVETEADPTTLSLTLEAMGRAQPTQLDAFFHRTQAPVYVSAITDTPGTADAPAVSFPAQPGSTTPRVNPILVVALALGLVAAVLLSRRKPA